ncbi:MAG: hypothetical protein EHM35_04370 [Planctomycetaceae bacterium]|nr:MAG: hypothetical protein EHM35_04370 [Planctomycetaceae bacterium]
MNTHLQAYLPGPEPLQNNDHTSLQRQAMGEVLRLSPAVLRPLESQIASDYQVAVQRAQDRLAADKSKIDAALQAGSQEIQRQYDARREATRADYEARLSTIKVDAQHGHNRVNQKATELKSKAEKEYQDQVMVVEYVAEGATTKVQQGRMTAQAAVQAARQYLDALGMQADELLRLYRQSVPPLGERAQPDTDVGPSPAEVYRSQQALAELHLETLGRLFTARLFVGVYPLLFIGGVLGIAVMLLTLLYLLKVPGLPSLLVTGPVTVGLVIVLVGLGGRALWQRAKRQVRREFTAFQEAVTVARRALDQQQELTLQDIEGQSRTSLEQTEAESRKAREALEATKIRIAKQRSTSLQEVDQRGREALDRLKQQRDKALNEAERDYREHRLALEQRHRQELAQVQARYDQDMAACENEHRTSRQRLEERLDKGLACVRAMLQDTADLSTRGVAGWDHLLVESWTPPQTPPSAVRFGAFALDLRSLTDTVRARLGPGLGPTGPVVLPALLEFPRQCSMLLQSPREGRELALETLGQ